MIDLYQVHAPDPDVPLEETLEALDGLVRAGKVRALGVSNFPAWLLAWAVALQDREGWSPFVSLQPQYSLVERSIEIEILPFCRAAGLGVIPWGPLGAGLPVRQVPARASARRRAAGSPTRARRWRRPTTGARSSATSTSSTRRGRSPRRAARRSRRSRSRGCSAPTGVTAPIVGPRTFAQLEDVLGADGLELTPEERARLEAPAPPPPVYPQRMLREQVGDPATCPRG